MEVNRNCGGQKKVWEDQETHQGGLLFEFRGSLFDCKRPSGRLGVVALFNCSATPVLTESLWKSDQKNTSTASSQQNLASEEQHNNTDAFWVQVQRTDEVGIEKAGWKEQRFVEERAQNFMKRTPVLHVAASDTEVVSLD